MSDFYGKQIEVRGMRVVLISPYSQVPSIGLRILSACLKRAGFETRMVFLPDVREMIVGVDYSERRVPPAALRQIVDLCADAGFVGISLMTHSFFIACQLTKALQAALDVPVLWGGVHPTVRPAECLRYADLVCIGEGEQTIVELAQRIAEGRDYSDVNNLAYLDAQGAMVTNPLYPLIQDLDALPFPDYEFEHHYVLHEGWVVRFSQNLMEYSGLFNSPRFQCNSEPD
jgi:anaerobic magnesium-protoporphyrin IX monomethyl ester cyclase